MVGCRGIPATYGGVERVVEELAIRLTRRGHKVSVICRTNYTLKMSTYNQVNIIRLPAFNQKHFEMITHTSLASLYLVLKKFDVVHIHSVDPAILTPFVKPFHPIVATSHGQAYRREKWGRIAKSLSRTAEKIFIKSPNICTAVSKTLAKYYFNKYGHKVTYIPNGIEIQQPVSSFYIEQFGLKSDKYILFVGRLMATKGPKLFIDAYKRTGLDMKLVIVGGSSHTNEYEMSLKKEADKNILFLGYQYGKTLQSLYSNCKIFVFPSQIEGLPIVLLEALSFLRPVIFSDIPENMEVANGIGIPFKSGDIDDLADKLNYAVKNTEKLNYNKLEIEKRLREEYDWDAITDKYISIYKNAINNGKI